MKKRPTGKPKAAAVRQKSEFWSGIADQVPELSRFFGMLPRKERWHKVSCHAEKCHSQPFFWAKNLWECFWINAVSGFSH
jgi:hypothetical protein